MKGRLLANVSNKETEQVFALMSHTLSDCNWLASLGKWLSVRVRTKWLWVRVPLQSLNLQISRLFRSSLTFRQLQSVDSLWNAYVTWKEHTLAYFVHIRIISNIACHKEVVKFNLLFISKFRFNKCLTILIWWSPQKQITLRTQHSDRNTVFWWQILQMMFLLFQVSLIP